MTGGHELYKSLLWNKLALLKFGSEPRLKIQLLNDKQELKDSKVK